MISKPRRKPHGRGRDAVGAWRLRVSPFVVALGVVGFLALANSPAQAQRTRFQGITQCQRYAAVQFSRSDPNFRRFVIERVSVQDDRFANLVGNQFVSAVFYGRGTYDSGSSSKRMRFICLHGGVSKGPVFIYVMPE
jgi:hypothetical protein